MYKMYEATVELLTSQDVPFTIHEHPPSHTVADAEERLPFPVERLLKAIAFKLKAGGYILAATRGPDRIDYRKLAAASGQSERISSGSRQRKSSRCLRLKLGASAQYRCRRG
jgi:prolyl-tRNA editing enzyme YbaK/EbsC (Cys-tRNA(Pro) deacylase)